METKISKQELIDNLEKTIRGIFETDHELAPVVFVSAGGELKPFASHGIFRNQSTKQLFVPIMKAYMEAIATTGLVIDYIAMVCEAYMVKVDINDKEARALAEELGASSMPDRIEVATFYVWSKESSYTRTWEIDRSGAEPKLVESMTNDIPIAEEPTGINFRNPFKEL